MSIFVNILTYMTIYVYNAFVQTNVHCQNEQRATNRYILYTVHVGMYFTCPPDHPLRCLRATTVSHCRCTCMTYRMDGLLIILDEDATAQLFKPC